MTCLIHVPILKFDRIYPFFKNAFLCANMMKVQFLKSPLGCYHVKMMNVFGFAYSMRIYRYVRILRKHKIENTLPAEKTCARSIPFRQSFKNKAKEGIWHFPKTNLRGVCCSIMAVPLAKAARIDLT